MPVSGRSRVHFTIPLDNRIFHIPAWSYERKWYLVVLPYRAVDHSLGGKIVIKYILPLLITAVVPLLAACEPGQITGNASSTYKSATAPAPGKAAPPPTAAAPAPGG
jgi:hypothetical protein